MRRLINARIAGGAALVAALGCGNAEEAEPFVPPELIVVDVGLTAGVQNRLARNRGASAVDFDGDGDVDVFVASPFDPARIYLNRGDGTFDLHPDPPTTGGDSAGAVADYDNDGDQDMYISCGAWELSCRGKLFRNDGPDSSGIPRFSDVSDAAGIGLAANAGFGGAWADIDNDGDLDLYANTKIPEDGADATLFDLLYINQGDGTFTEEAEARGLHSAHGEHHQGSFFDADLDGDQDLYIPTYGEPNYLMVNDGRGVFSDQTPDAMRAPAYSFAAVAEDFDNDGDVDVLACARSVGTHVENEFLFDAPHGFFWNESDGGLVNPGARPRRTAQTPTLQFRPGGGETGLDDPTADWNIIAAMGLQAGDMDLDGYPEVLFGNGSPDAGTRNALVSLRPMPGGYLAWHSLTRSMDLPAPEPPEADPPYNPYPYRTHGLAFFDMDGDDDIDLFEGNGGMSAGPWQLEPSRLWRNDTPSANRAVKVKVEGVTTNRDGIGAMIRVGERPRGEGGFQVFRLVHANSGFNSSQPLLKHVGVGTRPGPFVVEVIWPTGGVDRVTGVRPSDSVLLREGEHRVP